MDLHDLADIFRRFGMSPGYAALSTFASLIIMIAAVRRPIVTWWSARQRRKTIDYLATLMDAEPSLSARLEGHDDSEAREAATRMIAAAIQQTEKHIRLTAGKAMRRNADLPGTGPITSTQAETPLAGYEKQPPYWHVQQRIRRLASFVRMMMDEGTI